MLGSWDKAAPRDTARRWRCTPTTGELVHGVQHQLRGFGLFRASPQNRRLDDAAFSHAGAAGFDFDPKAEDAVRAKQALKSSLLLHAESSTSAASGRSTSARRRPPHPARGFRAASTPIETVKATAWYIRDECPARAIGRCRSSRTTTGSGRARTITSTERRDGPRVAVVDVKRPLGRKRGGKRARRSGRETRPSTDVEIIS